ncbi:MAG: hypothetical protein OJF62_002792 [Pseudolabrys sp.]|nr:hypothetical protein [Pseudolabrys sp.]
MGGVGNRPGAEKRKRRGACSPLARQKTSSVCPDQFGSNPPRGHNNAADRA